MADEEGLEDGEPTLEIKVSADYSEFDQKSRDRGVEAAGAGTFASEARLPAPPPDSTFGSEGRRPPAPLPAPALPSPADARAQAATERLALAMERQASAIERAASARAPLSDPAAGFAPSSVPFTQSQAGQLPAPAQLSPEKPAAPALPSAYAEYVNRPIYSGGGRATSLKEFERSVDKKAYSDFNDSWHGENWQALRKLDKGWASGEEEASEYLNFREVLSKAPVYSGKIYRGIEMPVSLLSSLQLGGKFPGVGLSSWAGERSAAAGFANGGATGLFTETVEGPTLPVILSSETSRGVLLNDAGAKHVQEEILLDRRISHRIAAVKETRAGRRKGLEFLLEELKEGEEAKPSADIPSEILASAFKSWKREKIRNAETLLGFAERRFNEDPESRAGEYSEAFPPLAGDEASNYGRKLIATGKTHTFDELVRHVFKDERGEEVYNVSLDEARLVSRPCLRDDALAKLKTEMGEEALKPRLAWLRDSQEKLAAARLAKMEDASTAAFLGQFEGENPALTAPAPAPAPAPAEFVGTQERPGGKPPIPLYNLTQDIPGHRAGSTVSGRTLEQAGYSLPAATPPASPPPPAQPASPSPEEPERPAPRVDQLRSNFRTGKLASTEGESIDPSGDVTLFHATTPARAKQLQSGGFDLSAKKPTRRPTVVSEEEAGRAGLESGELPYEPGRGLGQGLYLGLKPADVSQYGSTVLPVRVPVASLLPAPERPGISAMQSLGASDAYVESELPPSAFGKPSKIKRKPKRETTPEFPSTEPTYDYPARERAMPEEVPPGFPPEKPAEPVRLSGLSAEQVRAAVSAENYLGEGGNATVYRIPGSEHAVRVPGKRSSEQPNLSGPLIPTSDPFVGENFGQPVALLGTAQILRLQRGVPAGVPYGSVRKTGGPEADRLYEEHLLRTASMPQAAYDAFAKQLQLLNRLKQNFDPSKANNVLVDAVGKKFNLVDISPRDASSAYSHSASEMLVPLMDNAYAYKYSGSREQELKSFRRSIAEKSLSAARDAGLRLPSEKDSSASYSLQLAGWSTGEALAWISKGNAAGRLSSPEKAAAAAANSLEKAAALPPLDFGRVQRAADLLAEALRSRASEVSQLRTEGLSGQSGPNLLPGQGWASTPEERAQAELGYRAHMANAAAVEQGRQDALPVPYSRDALAFSGESQQPGLVRGPNYRQPRPPERETFEGEIMDEEGGPGGGRDPGAPGGALPAPGEGEAGGGRALAGGGTGGGGWGGGQPPFNIPNNFGGGGRTPRRNMTFYQRFLAIEAVRLGADLAYDVRQREIDSVMAGGDFSKQAMADVTFRNNVAGRTPLGIGKLAVVMRDPDGQQELAVTRTLAQAGEQDAYTESRRQRGLQSLRAEREAYFVLHPGAAGEAGKIEGEFQERTNKIKEETGKASEQEDLRYQQALNDLNTRGVATGRVNRRPTFLGGTKHLFTFGMADSPDDYEVTPIMREANDEDRRKLEGDHSQAMAKIRSESGTKVGEAEAIKAKELQILNARVDFANRELGIQADSYRAAATLTPQVISSRKEMLDVQKLALDQARLLSPEKVPALLESQRMERAAYDTHARFQASNTEIRARAERSTSFYRQTFQPYRASVNQAYEEYGTAYNASLLNREPEENRHLITERRDSKLAELRAEEDRRKNISMLEMHGATAISLAQASRQTLAELDIQARTEVAKIPFQIPADRPEERAAREGQIGAALIASRQEVFRQRGTEAIGIAGGFRESSALLARNPLSAQLIENSTARDVALSQMKADDPNRAALAAEFEQRKQVIIQQYKDARRLETRQLSTEEEASGIEATAFGPGAREKRLQAQVTRIAEGAETRAQARLQADSGDLANADRERRIGINELKATQASYLENMVAKEGSLYRTDLSGRATATPEVVLNSIDNGIKQLTAKIGTLVAAD